MQLSDRIGRRIKLQDVHVLMAVVQAGSMNQAARQLHTSQPNISKSIADLEHALGVRLLDRHRRGAEPTEFGRKLFEGGTAVFDVLRQTVKSISFLADPTVGEVRVGCNPFLAASFVTAVIERLSRRYPRAVFRLIPAYVDTLYRELTERNVDLLIARRFGPLVGDQFDHELLFEDSYWVAAGVTNPWGRRRKVKLAELANESWVLPPPETTTGSVALAAFRSIGLPYPRTTVIAEPVDVRISMLATGRFITIFPDSLFRFSARRPELKILPTGQRLNRLPVEIITLKNRTISPLAEQFIENARQLGAELGKGKKNGRNID